jgi:hypothetical protein
MNCRVGCFYYLVGCMMYGGGGSGGGDDDDTTPKYTSEKRAGISSIYLSYLILILI